ncbi:MAG TPA: nucleotidyltransferase family protein [Candidatus Binatia bacterium]|jgi:CTP:molybdopterin cytidylyltransferase MocA|nr:nucleotidyltransferase family protein [Candidatus Binatia bacterium]
MIAAIVLSAGESSRMGSPKALLGIDGKTFIEAIVSSLRETRVGKILVVLGHNAEQLRPKVEPLGVTVVVNPDYKKGQLSSLIAAVRSLETGTAGVEAILIHLVDHPCINPSVVNEMIDRFYASKKLIIIPTYKGKRGHPVLLSSRLFPELLSAPVAQGAKVVVRGHPEDTLELATEDEGVIIDVDTPEEYRKHLGRK